MKRWILLAALAAISLGCRATGPGYHLPDVDTPAEHRDADQPATTPSMADQPWWEVFRDPALQALIREAVCANQDLRVAAARVEQARALIGIARADGRPQADLALGVGRDYRSVTDPFGASDRLSTTYRAAIGATWELDLWGRIRAGTAAAYADMLSARDLHRATLVALVGDVAATYIELLSLDWQLDIARRTVETRTKTRDLFQKRLEGEIGSELEVARAMGDLAGAMAEVPFLEGSVTRSENALSLLLGRKPGPIARGAPLNEQTTAPEIPAGIPSELLKRRPDVTAAENALWAAAARVKVARADRFPRVSLTGLLGLESAQLSDLATSSAATWSLGAGLVAPLINGGRLKAAEAAAWASAEEAEARWVLAAQTAFRDVADALVSVRRSREVRIQQAEQVRARSRSMELAGLRFEGGLASYFEVLDAQRDLFPAELLAAAAKREELLAVVSLYRALGGGWQHQQPCAPEAERCPGQPASACPSFPPPSPCASFPAPAPAEPAVQRVGPSVPSTTTPQDPPPAPPVAAAPAAAAPGAPDLGAPPAGAPPFPASPSR
jgi:multidrug efflux system outer membrane protein